MHFRVIASHGTTNIKNTGLLSLKLVNGKMVMPHRTIAAEYMKL